jgi:hypothetical protein
VARRIGFRGERVQRARQIEGGLRRSQADQDRVEARRFGPNSGDRVGRASEADGLVPQRRHDRGGAR